MSTINPADVAEKIAAAFEVYFEAWKNQEADLVERLFTNQANYELMPAQELSGSEQIHTYWSNFVQRSRLVDVSYDIVAVEPANSTGTCVFSARLYDIQHQRNFVLGGFISISLDGDKIADLSGHFISEDRKSWMGRLRFLVPSRTGEIVNSIIVKMSIQWNRFALGLRMWLVPVIFASYFVLVLMTAWSYFLENKSFFGVEFDILASESEAVVSDFINACFAIGLVVHALLLMLRPKPALETKLIANRGVDDLVLMEAHMRHASKVTIVSGDFSFIAENGKLRQTLQQLANRRRLKLVSTKSADDVWNAANASTTHKRIIEKLADDSAISFHSSADVKCSIIERNGASVALFMYYSAEDNAWRIAILQELKDMTYLFQILHKLVGAIN